jgi:hypothetical protein
MPKGRIVTKPPLDGFDGRLTEAPSFLTYFATGSGFIFILLTVLNFYYFLILL